LVPPASLLRRRGAARQALYSATVAPFTNDVYKRFPGAETDQECRSAGTGRAYEASDNSAQRPRQPTNAWHKQPPSPQPYAAKMRDFVSIDGKGA